MNAPSIGSGEPKGFQFKIFSQLELESQDLDTTKKFKESFKDGFFYLEIPKECRSLINAGISFAESFYESGKIKSTKLSGFGGYNDHPELQNETHYAERADWSRLVEEGIYSNEMVDLAVKMNQLGITVLKKALSVLQIPEEKWDQLTGNLTSDRGAHHFSFNHYRSDRDLPGLAAHKDYGYITVLFVNKKGLQGQVDGQWVDVPPIKDHFIINFGESLEFMTEKNGSVNAINHRVPKMQEDRISFGVFLDGNLELPLCSYNSASNDVKKVFDTYQGYLDKKFLETYSK